MNTQKPVIITLRLPADTPVPVIGGMAELVGQQWVETGGHRWRRLRSGEVETSYTREQLALCVGLADYLTGG